MSILDRLRKRPSREEAPGPGPGPAETRPADDEALPIDSYDELDDHQLIARLSDLSQLELTAVEAHESSHGARPKVLNRLRWLRGTEPLPGYDALDSGEIVRGLVDADAATVKAVRSYESHHRARRDVLAKAAVVLPTARVSAGQARASEDKEALVQAGLRDKRSPDKNLSS
jgi:hypothetical protein